MFQLESRPWTKAMDKGHEQRELGFLLITGCLNAY